VGNFRLSLIIFYNMQIICDLHYEYHYQKSDNTMRICLIYSCMQKILRDQTGLFCEKGALEDEQIEDSDSDAGVCYVEDWSEEYELLAAAERDPFG